MMVAVSRAWRTTDWDSVPVDDAGIAEEKLLVQRARSDPAAFGPLYERYVDQIYRYCYQALGDRESAEDATSQTFAKALAALPKYRDNSLRGWLFTIARNSVTDIRRRRPMVAIDDASALFDADASPEEQAVARDARRQLRGALVQLTPDQRDVVELRLVGLKGVEIAVALGKPASAVKSLQFRAYARLRELLAEPDEREEAGRER
jgi:RNA polymerase sigma-70 factor (ECF subfamily)